MAKIKAAHAFRLSNMAGRMERAARHEAANDLLHARRHHLGLFFQFNPLWAQLDLDHILSSGPRYTLLTGSGSVVGRKDQRHRSGNNKELVTNLVARKQMSIHLCKFFTSQCTEETP